MKKEINVWVPTPPFSADPIHYDAFAHHAAFRSVFSSLLTQYSAGSYTGVLAKKWESSDNYKTWKFILRKNLVYSNGDQIVPEDISLSLKRILYLTIKNKSPDIILKNLVGYKSFKNIRDNLSGIKVNDSNDSIILSFTKPMPRLLENLSFGIYSLSHPSNFDHQSGKWIKEKDFISSGFYQLDNWENDSITLKLRKSFIPDFGNKNKFEIIRITADSKAKGKSDIIIGQNNSLDVPEQMSFVGGLKSGISYIQCISWPNKNNFLSSRENRIKIRDLFYQCLETTNIDLVKSFLPLAIKGVKEARVKNTSEKKIDVNKLNLVFGRPNRPAKDKPTKAVYDCLKMFKIKDRIITLQEYLTEREQREGHEFKFDLGLLTTGILIEAPDDDINFMINSKEGIQLPDVTGKLKKLTSQKKIDYQAINQEIWDQAIVWPITHHAGGIFVKDTIDTSLLNISLPPIDFSWIGHK